METAERETTVIYTCSMHPEINQDHPGPCPKCGMELIRKEKGGAHAPGGTKGGDHTEMTRRMREKWLWTNAAIALLGLWLISSPFTFGYQRFAMRWSDVISGALLVVFSVLAFNPRWDFIGRWAACFVGTWLQFAPLIFWAPTPSAYLNDTLVGGFVIALSVLVPMMPGMAHHMAMMKPGPEVPPGWTYNPSSWHQRAPMIFLAFLGWLVSRYLAAFELGYIKSVWEPFFGAGTVNVLTSKVSKSFPISDAGLGAAAYTFEFLMAWMGGKTRWRSMPWMVSFFFILVVPLGLTHITLVILQPMVVGSWCTMCLVAAGIMLTMIPFTVDEVIAMGQFLKASMRNGKSFWRTFWVGDTIDGGQQDNRIASYGASVRRLIPPARWGVTAPWNLVVSTLLGLWLMFAPAIFGTSGRAAGSDHLMGALIVTVTVISMAEVVRAGRFLVTALGLWVTVSPWLLASPNPATKWSAVATGLLLVGVSLRRGPVRERYASWDKLIV